MTRDEKLKSMSYFADTLPGVEYALEYRHAAGLLHYYTDPYDGHTQGVERIWHMSQKWRSPSLRRDTLRRAARMWHALDAVEATAKGGAA